MSEPEPTPARRSPEDTAPAPLAAEEGSPPAPTQDTAPALQPAPADAEPQAADADAQESAPAESGSPEPAAADADAQESAPAESGPPEPASAPADAQDPAPARPQDPASASAAAQDSASASTEAQERGPSPAWRALVGPRLPLFLATACAPSLLAGLLVLSGAPDRVWARLGGADAYEPNDTVAGARLVQPGVVEATCPLGDVDYYAIDVPAGKALRVTTDPAAEARGATSIHDAAGIPLASSRSGFWIERAVLVPDMPGRHLIRVWGQRGSYQLQAELVSPRRRFEPNDTRNDAAPLALGAHPGLLCNGDDWYRVTIPPNRELIARVAGEVPQLGLELVDGAQVAAVGSGSALAAEVQAVLSPSAREVLLHVAGAQAGYDLTLELAPPDLALLESRRLPTFPGSFEPNDNEASAPRIGPGVYPDLKLDGVDFYLVDVPDPNTTLCVSLVYDPRASLALQRTDPYTRASDSASQSSTGSQTLEAYLPQGGNQYLQVYGTSGTAYTMTVELREGAPGRALLPGDYTIQGTGDDRWRIDARAGELIDVRLTFDGNKGDIDMELSSAAGSVAASTGVTSIEHLSYQSPTDQPLFLRIYGPSQRYTLSLTVGGGAAPTPVTPNANGDLVTPLGRGEHALTVNGERVFEIELEAGQRLDVTLRNRSPNDWISGDLRSPSGGGSIATSQNQTNDGSGNSVQLSCVAEETGPVHLVTWGSSGSGRSVNFEALVRVDGRSQPDPTSIAAGRHGGLECPGEVLYALPIRGGQTVTARIEFAHADGDLDLALQDEAGNELVKSETTDDSEQVTWTAPLDMTVQVRVHNAPNVFDLDLQVE